MPLVGSVVKTLTSKGVGPFLGTPCGILAPLYERLCIDHELLTVGREETAIGIACGAAFAGRHPVVLMQNSGFAASINAIASLVIPFQLPILMIISLRGLDFDHTEENLAMGKATRPILDILDIPTVTLPGDTSEATAALLESLDDHCGPTALLVPPASFGWQQ